MKNILGLSKKFISIPSVTGDYSNCNKILGVATNTLKDYKHKTYSKYKTKSLLFYNTKTLPKKFKIILNGHLDVVPARDSQFIPKVVGNKIYGRGAYDMKAACAVMVYVFKELSKNVNYPIGLQLVADEEVGGTNGTGYQIDRGIKSEFVICGEPTDLKIGYKNRATYWIKLIVNGQSGHGAYPWYAKNALEILISDINNIKTSYKNPTNQTWKTTVSVTNINSNSNTINKIPSYADALLDIRPIPKDYKIIKKKISNIISKETKIKVISDATYHDISKKNKYFVKLKSSIYSSTKKNAGLLEKYGGNDLVHHYSKGAKGVLFGPSGGGMHSKTEWVNIKSLDTYYKILSNFILSV